MNYTVACICCLEQCFLYLDEILCIDHAVVAPPDEVAAAVVGVVDEHVVLLSAFQRFTGALIVGM